MPTNNRKKQTASSNASPISSQETSTDESASPTSMSGDELLACLMLVAREAYGQSKGVVERLCQTLIEASQGQVQLLLQGYQYQHTYATSSREHRWLSLEVEYGGRFYGKLEVAPHSTLPGQSALPYQQIQLLADNCALLLYNLETAAYFQRECPPPVKLIEVLTEREQEILELLCHGYQRKQIS